MTTGRINQVAPRAAAGEGGSLGPSGFCRARVARAGDPFHQKFHTRTRFGSREQKRVAKARVYGARTSLLGPPPSPLLSPSLARIARGSGNQIRRGVCRPPPSPINRPEWVGRGGPPGRCGARVRERAQPTLRQLGCQGGPASAGRNGPGQFSPVRSASRAHAGFTECHWVRDPPRGARRHRPLPLRERDGTVHTPRTATDQSGRADTVPR